MSNTCFIFYKYATETLIWGFLSEIHENIQIEKDLKYKSKH